MSCKMRAKTPASAVVSITDCIGMGGFYANDMRAALDKALGVKSLTVQLTSDGGNITEGLGIYSMLRAHGAKVRVEVLGVAASMGSVIAMAGDEIAMAEDAFMMIHNPASGVDGEAEDLITRAELLLKMRDAIANIYARRTGQDIADILEAMKAETWMTASEALALGYCTEIIPAKKMAARVRRFNKTPKALQRAERETMNPELLAKLGLKEDATEEDIMAAIDALQEAAKPPAGEGDDDNDEGGGEDDDDDTKPPANETATARARREMKSALRGKTTDKILSALAKLDKKIDGVAGRVEGSERDRLIADNIAKFNPKTEKQARTWPIAMLREFCEAADDAQGAIEQESELEGSTRPTARVRSDEKLTKEERHVAKLMGHTEEEVLAFKKNGLRLVKKGA